MRARYATAAVIMALSIFMYANAWSDPAYEKAIDAVLAFPWTNGPSSLPDSAGWEIEQYSEYTFYENPGYYSRAFVKKTGPAIVKFFSYSEPSITDFHDTILMGCVQAAVGTEEEAKTIHGEMAGYLKQRGFEIIPPDTSGKPQPLWGVHLNAVPYRKGDVEGKVYYIKDERAKCWNVRTSVSHTRLREFRNRRIHEWPNWWNNEYILPEKLVVEIEKMDIPRILSRNDWDIIRNVSSSDSVYALQKKNVLRVDGLVAAYEAVDKKAFGKTDLPAVLLFKNYLVRYIFLAGLEKKIEPAHKDWLERHGLGYTWSSLAQFNYYNEAILSRLVSEHSGSYWGQFAFLELLEMGFDTSGTCGGGQNQWDTVLTEGTAFLEHHPGSPFAPDIMFYLGKAAETLFNLGSMTDHPMRETSGQKLSDYSDTREKARTQAIEYYEKVLASPKKDVYTGHLRYILPRLRADIPTGTSYYFCFYD